MKSNVYKNESGVVVTDSLKIANAFGMRHGTVLEKARVFNMVHAELKDEVFEASRRVSNGDKKYYQYTWKSFQEFLKTFTSPHAEVVLADFKAEFWRLRQEVSESNEESVEATEEPKDDTAPSWIGTDEKRYVSQAELSLMMAEALVEQERKLKGLKDQIALLAQTVAEKITSTEVSSIEDATAKAYIELTERDEVKKLVEAYAEARFTSIGQAWAYMYSVLQVETGVVIAGERHGYTSKIHEVESKGLLPKLLDIARRLTGKK